MQLRGDRETKPGSASRPQLPRASSWVSAVLSWRPSSVHSSVQRGARVRERESERVVTSVVTSQGRHGSNLGSHSAGETIQVLHPFLQITGMFVSADP